MKPVPGIIERNANQQTSAKNVASTLTATDVRLPDDSVCFSHHWLSVVCVVVAQNLVTRLHSANLTVKLQCHISADVRVVSELFLCTGGTQPLKFSLKRYVTQY
jgi:hypothetical protein